ncbi:MAG: carbamoyltransferase C-terminal domain-containing protein [Nonlabens sp.]
MPQTYYIGIANTYHDPAIAIMDDSGMVLFAQSTERYLQYKRAIGCLADPEEYVIKILQKFCEPNALYVIATSWSAQTRRKAMIYRWITKPSRAGCIKMSLKKLLSPIYKMEELFWASRLQDAALKQAGAGTVKAIQKMNGTVIQVNEINHHRTHALNGCYHSTFNNAMVLVIDGTGESGSISYYNYCGGYLKLLRTNRNAASLGGFFMYITRLCGYNPDKGEEWKVMGLAACGRKEVVLYELLSKLYNVDKAILSHGIKGSASREMILKVERYCENIANKADIAHTGQLIYEQVASRLIEDVYKLGDSKNLILTGGCALNSAFNGKITALTSFEKVHIPPAPADDGNAIGAALAASMNYNPQRKIAVSGFRSPYLGFEITDSEMEPFIEYSGFSNYKKMESKNDLISFTAGKLAKGDIVGWVQGRAEFGPRALGNRSILADARNSSMRDRLNTHVKFREVFRPFAPVIMEEYAQDYFKNYQFSPYMERALEFKDGVKGKVPAAVHNNGTGRLQTVNKQSNELFYGLLSAFYTETETPLLLNTSLNVMGKPIVHSFKDAMSVFQNSDMDLLVVNDYVFYKRNLHG